MGKKVICINRQHGTGGNIIAEKLAENLGIQYLGRNLYDLAMAAMEAPEETEVIEKPIDRAPVMFFYRMYEETHEHKERMAKEADALQKMQEKLMTEAAGSGELVVVGHCAAEVLKDAGFDVLSVFMTASEQYRNEFIAANSELPEYQADDQIKKVDYQRKKYFYKHTGKNWIDPENYDLIINVERLGFDGALKMLTDLYNAM